MLLAVVSLPEYDSTLVAVDTAPPNAAALLYPPTSDGARELLALRIELYPAVGA